MDPVPPGEDTPSARAHALAGFFAEVSPRLLADVLGSGTLGAATPDVVGREWLGVALHACVRGVVSDTLASDAKADLVDAFHDEVLAPERVAALAGVPGAAGPALPAGAELRAFLARRYAEYDGIARTHGQQGAAEVPRAIARACAARIAGSDAHSLAEVIAPLLEALAEGALAAVTGVAGASGASARTPPLDGLHDLTARLDAAGIAWAVGGSALLAALGLVDEVNDWDVQVDADPEPLRALFADVPHVFHGHGGCHADWKLAFERERAELIPRFAFFVPDGVVDIPFRVSGRWRELPTASPEGWAVAYWLMGELDEPGLRVRRAERASALLRWLAEHGADAGVLAELAREPLPVALEGLLRALPRR